ncbi:uncharacterized protein CDAR_257591 [Caerostris darwini]|uniref:Uncharacterized protein n=1 Tax=Caerostris darwini TaxID=1538125 RepID=A0AAV4TEE0_9ARAC|nr:uncharacterized protein CDAR_257591 [Caerostris darwini]
MHALDRCKEPCPQAMLEKPALASKHRPRPCSAPIGAGEVKERGEKISVEGEGLRATTVHLDDGIDFLWRIFRGFTVHA